jgi:hypothetical protein
MEAAVSEVIPLRCRYCGGPDLEDGRPTGSGTCGSCWYGMRLEPERWEMEMEKLGRRVVSMPCIEAAADGGVAFICRNPFEPKEEP